MSLFIEYPCNPFTSFYTLLNNAVNRGINMNEKPKIGQTLYSLNIGDAARRVKQALTPVRVIKLGRKYFTTIVIGREKYGQYETQYHLSDWREKTEYSAHSELYVSEKSWEDKIEMKGICERLGKLFDYGRIPNGLDLESLLKMEEILSDI